MGIELKKYASIDVDTTSSASLDITLMECPLKINSANRITINVLIRAISGNAIGSLQQEGLVSVNNSGAVTVNSAFADIGNQFMDAALPSNYAIIIATGTQKIIIKLDTTTHSNADIATICEVEALVQ
jgi:hypothetical protein